MHLDFRNGDEMKFKPIKSKGIATKITFQIKQMVLSGELSPGDKLPTEDQMAKQFATSRSSVREALSGLKALGIIETQKGAGTFIRKLPPSQILEGIFPKKNDKELFVDLLEVRKVIEGKAVELAIVRGTDEDYENIRMTQSMLEDSLNKGEPPAVEADILFHLSISMAAHNEMLIRLTKNISETLSELRGKTLAAPGRLERSIREHEEIYSQIREGNINGAIKAIENHLTQVENQLDEWL